MSRYSNRSYRNPHMYPFGGPGNAGSGVNTLFPWMPQGPQGGPPDVPFTTAELAATQGHQAIREVSSERGLTQYGYAGVPFLSLANASLVRGPFAPEARIPTDMAGPLTYIPSTFNPAFSPTASGISPAGGPFTVTITPPVLDMQFIYPAVYITVTAPPLASLAGAISTFAVNGVTPSGGVNAFLPTQPAPLVGTPPVFQIQPQNVGVLTVNILLFGGVIVDAKPIFAPYSIATAWNGPMGTAFAAPITMPFSVAFEGWPDGAQASVTLCTWEHPQLQELRRMIMPAAA